MNSLVTDPTRWFAGLVCAAVFARAQPSDPVGGYEAHAIAQGEGREARSKPLSITGLASVTVDVSDLGKTLAFYEHVAGFDQAFEIRGDDGQVASAFLKVNDEQFVELRPGKPNWQTIWHFAFRCDDLAATRQELADRGFQPGPVAKRPDGNLGFRLEHLPGQQLNYLEFVQYLPDSLSERTRGRFLSPRRLSDHLEHAGIVVTDFDAAYRFYQRGLGFEDRYMRFNFERTKVILDQLSFPGPKMEFVELFNFTGSPAPITHAVAKGAVHFALTVPDDLAVFKETAARGIGGHRPPPRFAWDNRYNTNIFDPDGTRVEFMQPEDPQRPTPLVVYTPLPAR